MGVIQCVLQSIPDCPPEASNICLQAPLCLFWRSTDEHRSRWNVFRLQEQRITKFLSCSFLQICALTGRLNLNCHTTTLSCQSNEVNKTANFYFCAFPIFKSYLRKPIPPSSATENEGGPSMAEETGIPRSKIISCDDHDETPLTRCYVPLSLNVSAHGTLTMRPKE